MIPSEQLNKIAKSLVDKIKDAKVYMGDSVKSGTILKKTVKDNVIKVFVSLSEDRGTVTKIEIIDSDGEVFQYKDVEIIKDNRSGFLAVVEIRVESEEIYGN